MASTVERKCKNRSCGVAFIARTADVKRGWAKFCSKSCKATDQERRTHQYATYAQRRSTSDGDDLMGHIFESGYFGHGQE
jgi:hypothetical protein